MTGAQPAVGPDPVPAAASRQNTLVAIMFVAAGLVFLHRFGTTYLFPVIGPEPGPSDSQLGSLSSVTAVS